MKHAKKLLCLLLIFAMTFTLLVACKKDEDETPAADEIPTTEINLSEYAIIRSTKNGSVVTDTAKAFSEAAKTALGSELAIKRDNEGEVIADAKEILIGQTNRDESTAALTDLGDKFAFSIRVSGNKITVIGATNELIVKAINFLQENYLTKMQDGKLQVPTDYTQEFEYHELVKDGKAKYKVVYSDAEAGTENFASVKGIKSSIDSYLSGSGMDFGTGSYKNEKDLKKKLIVVGNTNFPHSQELANTLGLFSWAMESKGDQIYVCAFEAAALKTAGNKLTERLGDGVLLSTATAEKKTIRICKIERVGGDNDKWNTEIPLFSGGMADSFLQIEQGFYRMRYTKTDRASFDTYVGTLESNGFQLYDSNTLDNNVFNTYYKDDVMLHTYFTENTKSVSIVLASASAAPKYALEAYTDNGGSADAKLTLMDMNYKSSDGSYAHNNGMGFLFTMSDGSYVVVDGGHSNDAEKLYQYMVDNNTRTDGKILIRAWILTHPDGDHWGALVRFANAYGNNAQSRPEDAPEIILEKYVAQYHYNSYQNGDIRDTVDNITNALKKFGSYERVVPLLGQTMYLGEAEFTFLATAELPTTLTLNTNEQSLIMNVAFEGKKVLMLGDAVGSMTAASNQIFDAAFRADFLQGAHHGLNPAPIDLKSQATAVIFCTHKTAAGERYAGYASLINQGAKKIVADGGYKTVIS